MKKVLLMIVAFLIITCKVYALDIDIESVSIRDKSDTIEVSNPVLEDSTINSNIVFNEVGDYVTYEIKLKNNSNEELNIEDIKDNNENEFVVTRYGKDGLNLLVTLEYQKELTGTLELSDIEIEVTLDNGEEVIINPKTFDNNMNLYMFLILFSLIAVAIIIKLKEKSIGALIVIIMIVPVMLMASSSFKINITFKSENIVIANNDVVPDEPEPEPSYPIEFVSRQDENSISVGDEISIAGEHFYVVSSTSEKTVMLSKYNLYVGDVFDYDSNSQPAYTLNRTLSSSDEGYGLQNELAIAQFWINGNNSYQYVGTVQFAATNYWDQSVIVYDGANRNYTGPAGLLEEYSVGDASYNGNPYPYVYRSNMNTAAPENVYNANNHACAQNNGYTIAYFVENYVNKLKELGSPNTISGRLLSYEEATSLGCVESQYSCKNTSTPAPAWVYNTGYWLGSVKSNANIWEIESNGSFGNIDLSYDAIRGVRPVIEIETSYLN